MFDLSTPEGANSPEVWDHLWKSEGEDSWRVGALEEVYDRIVQLCPRGAQVVDLGGGRGFLARRLMKEKGCHVLVVDHSIVALEAAREAGCRIASMNLADGPRVASWLTGFKPDVVIATEVLEHLPEDAREAILDAIGMSIKFAFLSVPNDRLGPDEEPQHTCKFTALEWLRRMRCIERKSRVECLGPLDRKHGAPSYILGVVGFPKKTASLSVTLPVRNEADDLALTLATFRAVADEIVVGVDHRTTDATREIAAKYAEIVFDIDDPRGPTPDEDKIPENGVHFAHIRNRCIERCTSDWIFMTEGHEHLQKGVDTLLALGDIAPKGSKVGYVWRTGQGQRWAFPWLFANDTRLRFTRHTHNQLAIPHGVVEIRLPGVETNHRRSHANATARTRQRVVQNRKTLLDDWVMRGNSTSLYYLAAEARDPVLREGMTPEETAEACARASDKAIRLMEEYLALPPKNGPARYQTRLALAKEYADAGRLADARAMLLRCTEDDWTRVEHWLWLGDLAYEADKIEEALYFWRYASSAIGHPPFTLWWIDEDVYSYLPAQRLVQAYASLGRLTDAHFWANRVLELLPPDAPAEARKESEEIEVLIASKLREEDNAEDAQGCAEPVVTERIQEENSHEQA